MRPAFLSLSPEQAISLLRRRTTVLLLVLLGHALLMVLLLRLTPPPGQPSGEKISTFELLPDRAEETREEPQEEARPTPIRRDAAEPRPDPPPPPPIELPYRLPIITLTREEFATADIAKMPQAEASADSSDSAEAAMPGDSVPIPGGGPNGEPMYNAEWQRRPTQAELGFYLPSYVPRPGWALIACQTADRFKVENCQELGQSHTGAALASAIREAAWQFRVIPPRKGGKKLIGTWVRIRIDFIEAGATEDQPPG